jgi:hypothetical protein
VGVYFAVVLRIAALPVQSVFNVHGSCGKWIMALIAFLDNKIEIIRMNNLIFKRNMRI